MKHQEIEKHEKKVLTNKIAEQAKEIDRLQARINELSAELHQMKIEETTKPAKITKLLQQDPFL